MLRKLTKNVKNQPRLRFSDFGNGHHLSYLMLFDIRRTENDRIALCNYFRKRSQKLGLWSKIPMYVDANSNPMVLCLRLRFSKFCRVELSFILFFFDFAIEKKLLQIKFQQVILRVLIDSVFNRKLWIHDITGTRVLEYMLFLNRHLYWHFDQLFHFPISWKNKRQDLFKNFLLLL